MISKCSQALAATCFSLATLGSVAQAVEEKVVGKAYDLETGDYLYSEHHLCNAQTTLCNVLYRDDQGELIARKQVDYSSNLQSPSLQMEDFRLDAQVELQPLGDPELVVDAGFDNYVRLRWDELAQGATLKFPFQIMGRSNPLAMQAKRVVETDGCGSDELCLEVALNSWLLGMIVDPIELTYEVDSRRLMRFRGISNVRGDEGEKQFVDIRYSYSE